MKNEDLEIERASLLAAMGYAPGSPSAADEAIDEVLISGRKLCNLQGGYRIIDSMSLERGDFSILANGVNLGIHRLVFRQLQGANRMAVFACTVGSEIGDKSKEFMKNGDLLKGYVYDLFGSLAVESAMDLVQARLQADMRAAGLKITNRYSPGYCGWNVSEQKRLFSLLPEHFCGIKLTESCLMLPTKSVSGIIGIGESVKYNPYTCNLCDAKNCLYRNLKRGAAKKKSAVKTKNTPTTK